MRRFALFFGLIVACKVQESAPAPVEIKPAAKVETFGAAIHAGSTLALADVAKHKGENVVTEGKVSRVCQERGCWLALRDESGKSDAVVRMHGHTFFVPTTSAGKHARVEGKVLLMKDGHECDEMEAEHAQLEIDATGVELD